MNILCEDLAQYIRSLTARITSDFKGVDSPMKRIKTPAANKSDLAV